MSLTQLIRTDPCVRAQLKAWIRKPPFQVKGLQVAPTSTRYNVTGTAFDYLLRFTLEQRHPKQRQTRCTWVAEHAMMSLTATQRRKARTMLNTTRELTRQYCAGEDVVFELARASTILAKLDLVYRSGWEDPTLLQVDEAIALELLDLLAVVPWEEFVCQKILLTNPHFGHASGAVGGADADLLLDTTLIDIKTTQKAEVSLDELRQLAGYFLLGELGGIWPSTTQLYDLRDDDLSPCGITHVGLYYARHGTLLTWPVAQVLTEALPTMRKWWADTIKLEEQWLWGSTWAHLERRSRLGMEQVLENSLRGVGHAAQWPEHVDL
ncbi:hypothetical protein [Deinococcus aquatilis]|uniref:hypothetical protein n=1 Tax=Deinococcus aquatilis TaxID=519440 RepID=UPI000371416F|nr:hypothetical protein [Deinococcus aquatilis]